MQEISILEIGSSKYDIRDDIAREHIEDKEKHISSVMVNGQEYKQEDKVILPDYPNSLPASDVPAWAKEENKPEYTAAEVGAIPENASITALAQDENHRTVTDIEKELWNNKSDFDGNYNSLSNKPLLGTAADKDVNLTGDARDDEVVLGNDSRLTNSRPASDVYDWAKAEEKPEYTFEEVNALSKDTQLSDLPTDESHRTVTDVEKEKWNNKSDFDGEYSSLNGIPLFGTAAYKNVPASGNANASQVVLGNDSRLTDARPASDVSEWAKESTKPTYTAAEVGAIPVSSKGSAGGVAELDENGLIPSNQLPSYVDDVVEYNSFADFPIVGESSKIYIDKSENKQYRWSGTQYIAFSANGTLVLGETENTAFRGDHGKAAYDHISRTNNPHGVTKAQIGLENVENKSSVDIIAEITSEDITSALGLSPVDKVDAVIDNSISIGRLNGSQVGEQSIAIGDANEASGSSSSAIGEHNKAIGFASFVEGGYNEATGLYNHVEGYGNKSNVSYQHVEGMYNEVDEEGKYLHIVGNGSEEGLRANAYALDKEGNGFYAGDVFVGENKIRLTKEKEIKLYRDEWGENPTYSQYTNYLKQAVSYSSIDGTDVDSTNCFDGTYSFDISESNWSKITYAIPQSVVSTLKGKNVEFGCLSVIKPVPSWGEYSHAIRVFRDNGPATWYGISDMTSNSDIFGDVSFCMSLKIPEDANIIEFWIISASHSMLPVGHYEVTQAYCIDKNEYERVDEDNTIINVIRCKKDNMSKGRISSLNRPNTIYIIDDGTVHITDNNGIEKVYGELDIEMLDDSENGVQNKVIKSYIDEQKDKIEQLTTDISLKADTNNPNFTGTVNIQNDIEIKGNICHKGTMATTSTIEFYDTEDNTTGNGVGICAGGYTIIGGGESRDKFTHNESFIPYNEKMVVANDHDIDFYSNCQDGLNSAFHFIMDKTGNFSVPGKINNVDLSAITSNGAITEIQVVDSLPADAASHPTILYLSKS